jgi:hypothetical protein
MRIYASEAAIYYDDNVRMIGQYDPDAHPCEGQCKIFPYSPAAAPNQSSEAGS